MIIKEPIINKDLFNKDFSNAFHTSVLKRHRWYYFKEGFSPYIVKHAIENTDLADDDIIFDPFLGSGTSGLVAAEHGKRFIGSEVNPFLCDVSRTKISKATKKKFNKYKALVFEGIKDGKKSPLEAYSTFGPNNNKKWLFNTDVLRAFEGGYNTLSLVPKNERCLYKLALINAAMANSNASRDGKCLRYKKNWDALDYNKESFKSSFDKFISRVEDDLEETICIDKPIDIINKDVRTLNLTKKIKLCITSPPYLNSFDYTDIYRPELFLGKYLSNNEDVKQLRLKTLRSHVQVQWEMAKKKSYGFIYDSVFNEIYKRKEALWNKRLIDMIPAYFEDIELLLKKIKNSAYKKTQIWIIVSTSAYAGVEIPVDLIIADIGSKLGLNFKEIMVTRYINHSPQNAMKWFEGALSAKRLRESIIVFDGYY